MFLFYIVEDNSNTQLLSILMCATFDVSSSKYGGLRGLMSGALVAPIRRFFQIPWPAHPTAVALKSFWAESPKEGPGIEWQALVGEVAQLWLPVFVSADELFLLNL